MVKVNRPLSKQLFGTVLLLSVLTTACGGEKKGAKAPPAIPVKLQALESATVIDSNEFVGTLVAHQFVQLAPKINGRILKIFADFGQTVKVGDPIILLEPEQQQEQVNAAVGNVNVQKASLDKADADVRTTEAQRDAAKADVANSRANLANAQETLKKNEADLRGKRADLELAQINFKRSKFLVETGVQPQQDLDNKTTALKNTQESVQAAEKTVEASKASVNAGKAAVNQVIQNLNAAQERVSAARASVNQQKASISQAQGQLGVQTQELIFNKVVSPINGVVGTISNKVGDYLNQGQNFTTITDNSVMEMNINIPIERGSRLRLGLPVEIINEDGSAGVAGKISFISPTVNQNAQAILTKVIFRNDGRLKNSQYLRVRVIWNRQPGVLIPTTAVTSLGAQKFVFVAEKAESKEGKSSLVVKQKPVQVGTIQGQKYQVISGVKPGEKIAVNRLLDLRDGISITDESLMKKEEVKQ